MTTNKLPILIVADDPRLGRALRTLLLFEPDFDVVDLVRLGQKVLHEADTWRFEVALISLPLHDADGFEVIAALARHNPGSFFIIMSKDDISDSLPAEIAPNVQVVLGRPPKGEALVRAIRNAHESHARWLSQRRDQPRPSQDTRTTPREMADPHDKAKQAAAARPKLVFRAPTLNQALGGTTYALLILVLMLPVILLGVLAVRGDEARFVLAGLLVLLILMIGTVGVYILLATGRVVLNADKLVEYNRLGFSRTFTYTQIYEVKLGSDSRTWIHYYPLDKSGYIDHAHSRETTLVSVRNDAKLRSELAQRITATSPNSPQALGWGRYLIYGVIVGPLLILILLGYVLFVAR